MFEKYTDKARKVIFFARYEAGQLGSSDIKPEHILPGLFRVDAPLLNSFAIPVNLVQGFHSRVEDQSGSTKKIFSHKDLALSASASEVLRYAEDESFLLDANHIGTEQILLGLLHDDTSLANAFLREHGLSLSAVRASVRGHGYLNLNDAQKAERVSNIVIELRAIATAIIKECDELESMGNELSIEENSETE